MKKTKIIFTLIFIFSLFLSFSSISLEKVSAVTGIAPGKDAPTANTSYKLLAPIGGFTELTTSTNIGEYFNIMIRIAIGLCAVLAVIMIVIGGIQYMGNESIFGKSEAKGQITKAIFGLIIALGSYALLNTVDPALLGGNGLNVKAVSAEIIEVFSISGAATANMKLIIWKNQVES